MLLILDGFTLDGKIPARGPYQEVNFRYRPALAEDVYDYTQGKQDTGRQRLTATVALVAKHLASWDVLDDRGTPIPITSEVLRKVPQSHLEAMLNYVTGYTVAEQASDAKN